MICVTGAGRLASTSCSIAAAALFLSSIRLATSQNVTVSGVWPCTSASADAVTMLSETRRSSPSGDIEEICSIVQYGSKVNSWCSKTACSEYNVVTQTGNVKLQPVGDSCATASINTRQKVIAWSGSSAGFYSVEAQPRQTSTAEWAVGPIGDLEGVYEMRLDSDKTYWSIHHRSNDVFIFSTHEGMRHYKLRTAGNTRIMDFEMGYGKSSVSSLGTGNVLATGDIVFPGGLKLYRWSDCTALPELPGWPKCGCFAGDQDADDLVAGAHARQAQAVSAAAFLVLSVVYNVL